MSYQAKLVKKIMPSLLAGWGNRTLQELRLRNEKLAKLYRLPADLRCLPTRVGNISAEWIKDRDTHSGVMLYLHGGGYVMGSINTHRELISRIVRATKLKVLVINYRLAPEHPHPAALEDAIAAYHWLLDQDYHPAEILFAGDSAGGALAVAAMVALRDAGNHLPAGAICISPWTDLTLSGGSIKDKAHVDCMLNVDRLALWAKLYSGGNDPKLPLISPRYADLSRLPPLLIQVGEDEVLLDDALHLAEDAEKAGVNVQLEVWESMFHVFQMFPFLPQSKKALRTMAQFSCRLLKKDQEIL